MINIPKSKCIGCGACHDICPKSCIEMKADKEGFSYPDVNKALCINCGACEKVCPALNPIKKARVKSAFGAYNKDDKIRLNSSSGGFFFLAASYILDKGGVVFGAAFDDRFQVRHIAVEKKEELPKIMASKYVQSNTAGVFLSVKSYLKKGRTVLFSGTPCQNNALSLYLKKDYPNLLKADIICHGVPSPQIWDKYLCYTGKGKKASDVRFREKSQGWSRYHTKIIFENGYVYDSCFKDDLYSKLFLSDLILRPSCYECPAKNDNRASDITIADFWGIGNLLPELNDDKGTSLIIINNDKGKQLFDSVKDSMIFKETDFSRCIQYNSSYSASVQKPKLRDSAFEYLLSEENPDFAFACSKFIKLKKNGAKKYIDAAKAAVAKILKTK